MQRVSSIDRLRGFVIILMALDHVRTFWGPTPFSPVDPGQTTVAWFLTRWITHICAPVFVFLAGTGAFLYQSATKSRGNVIQYLMTRGALLIMLEVTVVNLSWHFEQPGFVILQVIWVLGVSMIVLGAMIPFPRPVIWAFGLLMIFGHNLLDGIRPFAGSEANVMWALLHVKQWVAVSGIPMIYGIMVVYPLIPWIGVMALGYAAGPAIVSALDRRPQMLLFCGAALTGIFILLRFINAYGDPLPWAAHETTTATVLSFLNTEKYPPSLLFLCMTIGPALMVLYVFSLPSVKAWDRLQVFGRVPLFFYLLHLPLIHIAANIWSRVAYDHPGGWRFLPSASWPEAYVPNLLRIYIVWVLVTCFLFFPCRWYKKIKERKKAGWLRLP